MCLFLHGRTVREREKERDSKSVCVCVCERETERERGNGNENEMENPQLMVEEAIITKRGGGKDK